MPSRFKNRATIFTVVKITNRSVFVCQACGAQSLKMMGRCTDCGAWNTFVEEQIKDSSLESAGHQYTRSLESSTPQLMEEVEVNSATRLPTGIDEFDRVLGGGVVPGSLILLGGEPGIGKSTLLLQAAAHFSESVGPVLYASGEESEHQIKSRGDRLGVGKTPLYLLSETCIESIVEHIARLKPSLVIVDSIQTVFSTKFQSAPGSVGQVREAATQLLFVSKAKNIPTILVGHVTKDGSLAGPKVLEHVVDTVLYFEGDRDHTYRVVRAVKNRFGPVSELGIFEMTERGLHAVPNPSALFLSERALGSPGSAVLCCVEGSRPMLLEVQALVSTSTFGNARRTAVGIDQSRLSMLLAVLEKRIGLNLIGEDVYVNVAGGMNVDETAADLSVVAAVVSSVRNRGLKSDIALFGEVGLSGEIRGAPQAGLRVREAIQMGFARIVMPAVNTEQASRKEVSQECIGVRTLEEALEILFP